jgi:hypothetical protein
MSSPKQVIRVGAVNVSIFENTIVKDGKMMVIPKAVFQVRYKDKHTGEWKSTSSLSVNDIPKAISALQKAYQFLTEKDQRMEDTADSEYSGQE